METSKKSKCLPFKDIVFREKSIDESTGTEKAIKWNQNLAFNQYQAQRACKHLCSGICKSFTLKKFGDRRGYNCKFYSSVVDPKNCQGSPGKMYEPETTYMKYEYGDCQFANKNTTKECCNEDYL